MTDAHQYQPHHHHELEHEHELEHSHSKPQASLLKDASLVEACSAEASGLTCLGDNVQTEFIAETKLPTNTGFFRVRAYRSTGSLRSSEPMAIVFGDVEGKHGVPVRVHDQCFTSEVFGSLKCDCREQLDFAKAYIREHTGVVIYMPQEGRGIGLANKIKAYSMQEVGYDTVDANRILGFGDDYRSYEPVKAILDDLQIQSIQLLTNNPRKIRLLSELSIQVDGRLPVIIQAGEFSQRYLAVKASRMAHLLPMSNTVSPVISEDNDTDNITPESSTTPSSPTNSMSSSSSSDDIYQHFQFVV